MKMDKSVFVDESEVWKQRSLNSVRRRKQMAHVMQMVMIGVAVFVVAACVVTMAFRRAKGGVSHCKRRQIAMRFAAFRIPWAAVAPGRGSRARPFAVASCPRVTCRGSCRP